MSNNFDKHKTMARKSIAIKCYKEIFGPLKRCPKCDSPPDKRELRGYNLMCGDGGYR